jgi:hypothetical protein
MRESIIRSTELIFTIASTYMSSVTLVQTTLYNNGVSWLETHSPPELMLLIKYFDLLIIALSLMLTFWQWKKGTENAFTRIFSLNMLLFFPAIMDFSRFNWIGLIIGLIPSPKVSPLWVFAVGLLLQVNFLWMRQTLRFRFTRENLLQSGATLKAVNKISGGQMWYLMSIILGTSLASICIFMSASFTMGYIMDSISSLPYPQLLVGIITAILLSVSIILYLRGSSKQQEEQATLNENHFNQPDIKPDINEETDPQEKDQNREET